MFPNILKTRSQIMNHMKYIYIYIYIYTKKSQESFIDDKFNKMKQNIMLIFLKTYNLMYINNYNK